MKFVSKFSELSLTMIPTDREIVRGKIVTHQGKHIRFHRNEYNTTDQKEIAWLKQHPNYGIDFYAVKEDPIDKLAKVKRQVQADDQNI